MNLVLLLVVMLCFQQSDLTQSPEVFTLQHILHSYTCVSNKAT